MIPIGLALRPMQVERDIKRNRYHARYQTLTDEQLKEIYWNTKRMYGDRQFDPVLVPEEFHKAGAAVNLLRERQGDKILEELGIRRPNRFIQILKEYLVR